MHEDTPRYALWLKLLLGGMLALTLTSAVVLLSLGESEGAYAMFAATTIQAAVFHAMLPRRYQVLNDRVRIVLGWPFAKSIRFSTVQEVRPASGCKAMAYHGMRFTTSTRGVVEIVRSRGLDVVITPGDPDVFTEQANRALKAFRRR